MLYYKMKDIWQKYALVGMLLFLYTVMGKPKGNTTRNLWLLYCAGSAVIGMNVFNLNNDDNKQ